MPIAKKRPTKCRQWRPELQERNVSIDRWLQDEVVSTYDAMQANPDRGISVDQVSTALAARHAARAKRAGCAA